MDWSLLTPAIWAKMQRLARHCALSYGNPSIEDELMGVFLDAMPGLMERYDKRVGFWPYAKTSLRWLAYKYVRRTARRACEQLDDPETFYLDASVAVEVQLIGELLGTERAELLIMRYALEYTWSEMAHARGCSVNKVRKDTTRALDDAKTALLENHRER